MLDHARFSKSPYIWLREDSFLENTPSNTPPYSGARSVIFNIDHNKLAAMDNNNNNNTSNNMVLLLGMVYNPAKTEPARGQEFRDRVRCESLERLLGKQVYTLDDKHADQTLPRHCQANFANARRMVRAMEARWGPDVQFESIHLDYFFSPAGWSQTRWGNAFFQDSLPALSTHLAPGGSIWLPYSRVVEGMIQTHADTLGEWFVCDRVMHPDDSVLYRATDRVEDDLLRCPDAITNATQLAPCPSRPFSFLVLRTWS